MPGSNLHVALIREGLVTAEQVGHAMKATLGTNTTWIEYLLLSRQLEEGTLVDCSAATARVPRANLDRLAHVPGDVLAALPGDIAAEHRVVPLGVEPDGDVDLAMIDPCDGTAKQEIEFFLGRRVLREVAPASWILWALTTYYGASCAAWPPRKHVDTGSTRRRRMVVVAPPPARVVAPPARVVNQVEMVTQPIADELAYDLEVTCDGDPEIVGRARGSGAVLIAIPEESTERIVPPAQRHHA